MHRPLLTKRAYIAYARPVVILSPFIVFDLRHQFAYEWIVPLHGAQTLSLSETALVCSF